MNYLALSKEQLSRLSHHWLWGLRIGVKTRTNLYQEAEKLQANPELLQTLGEQVTRVDRRPSAIRALYWLFNIDQYRLHYYQLQAHTSLQLYQKGITMFSGVDGAIVGAVGAFVVGAAILGRVYGAQLLPQITAGMAWFRQRFAPHFPNVSELNLPNRVVDAATQDEAFAMSTTLVALTPAPLEQQENSPSDEAAKIMVSDNMQVLLRVLGLNKATGTFVSFTEIKSAYRRSCLATHPDKTGTDSGAAFGQVKRVYQAILSIIQQSASADTTDDFTSLFVAKMVALAKAMDEQANVWRAMAQRVSEQTAVVRAMGVELKAHAVELKAHAVELSRQSTETARQLEIIRGLRRDTKGIKAQVEAMSAIGRASDELPVAQEVDGEALPVAICCNPCKFFFSGRGQRFPVTSVAPSHTAPAGPLSGSV